LRRGKGVHRRESEGTCCPDGEDFRLEELACVDRVRKDFRRDREVSCYLHALAVIQRNAEYKSSSWGERENQTVGRVELGLKGQEYRPSRS